MKLTVRYFASLREAMGKSEEVVAIGQERLTVGELWSRYLSQTPMSPNTLIAVNMEYANSAELVGEGDEVAFFPPVTGG